MRLYAAAGQPSASRRQYRELERILQEELGEPPSSSTRALADQLAAASRQPARGASAGDVRAEPKSTPQQHPLLAANRHLPTGAPSGTVTFLLTDIERSMSVRRK